jgi:hypothetical protein
MNDIDVDGIDIAGIDRSARRGLRRLRCAVDGD